MLWPLSGALIEDTKYTSCFWTRRTRIENVSKEAATSVAELYFDLRKCSRLLTKCSQKLYRGKLRKASGFRVADIWGKVLTLVRILHFHCILASVNNT